MLPLMLLNCSLLYLLSVRLDTKALLFYAKFSLEAGRLYNTDGHNLGCVAGFVLDVPSWSADLKQLGEFEKGGKEKVEEGSEANIAAILGWCKQAAAEKERIIRRKWK